MKSPEEILEFLKDIGIEANILPKLKPGDIFYTKCGHKCTVIGDGVELDEAVIKQVDDLEIASYLEHGGYKKIDMMDLKNLMRHAMLCGFNEGLCYSGANRGEILVNSEEVIQDLIKSYLEEGFMCYNDDHGSCPEQGYLDD